MNVLRSSIFGWLIMPKERVATDLVFEIQQQQYYSVYTLFFNNYILFQIS